MKGCKSMKARKGFTLIELIVVVAVLLSLSVLAAVAYRGMIQEAERTRRVANANALATSLNSWNAMATQANQIKTLSGSVIALQLVPAGLMPSFSGDVPGTDPAARIDAVIGYDLIEPYDDTTKTFSVK